MRLLSASFAHRITLCLSRPEFSTFDQALRAIPKSQQWSVQRCQSSQIDGADVVAAIIAGTAIAVSDGSFKDSFGTSAWTVRGDTSDQFLTGVNVVPGSDEDQSAFRSELAGIYGILTAVSSLCSLHEVLSGGITVACDGESALDYIFDWETKPIKSSTPHLDIISASRKIIQKSPLQWKFRHVYGIKMISLGHWTDGLRLM